MCLYFVHCTWLRSPLTCALVALSLSACQYMRAQVKLQGESALHKVEITGKMARTHGHRTDSGCCRRTPCLHHLRTASVHLRTVSVRIGTSSTTEIRISVVEAVPIHYCTMEQCNSALYGGGGRAGGCSKIILRQELGLCPPRMFSVNLIKFWTCQYSMCDSSIHKAK